MEGRSGTSSTAVEKSWTELWKSAMPSKIKVFLWRLARHSLPTTDVLHHRNMAAQNACPLCGAEDSWRHALLSCSMSSCVWALADDELVSKMSEFQDSSAKVWLFELSKLLDHTSFTKMVVTLWAMWFARRKAVYEGIFQNPQQTIGFVNTFIAELDQITMSRAKVDAPRVIQAQPNCGYLQRRE